jgi:Spy/CpxP family protein refolding chaperone
MTKKTTLTVSAIVVAVLALAAVPFLYAGPGHVHGMGAGIGPLGHLAHAQKELGLSDQQVVEIKAIFKSVHDQNAQYRDQLHGGFASVMSTLLKNPNDVAAAQAIMDQQATAERAMKANLLGGASKALNVLTPDQRDKLGTMISQHQARFQRQF